MSRLIIVNMIESWSRRPLLVSEALNGWKFLADRIVRPFLSIIMASSSHFLLFCCCFVVACVGSIVLLVAVYLPIGSDRSASNQIGNSIFSSSLIRKGKEIRLLPRGSFQRRFWKWNLTGKKNRERDMTTSFSRFHAEIGQDEATDGPIFDLGVR